MTTTIDFSARRISKLLRETEALPCIVAADWLRDAVGRSDRARAVAHAKQVAAAYDLPDVVVAIERARW